MSENIFVLFLPITWLITGHTIVIIMIYNFGFSTKIFEKNGNKDIYRYVRFLQPFSSNPIPDPSSNTNFYKSCRKLISIILITCQTLVTVIIAAMIVK